jgi:hypothetical protein
VSSGIDLDYDAGIAIGAVIAAHTQTEKRGMRDPARRFRFPEASQGFPERPCVLLPPKNGQSHSKETNTHALPEG